MESLTWVWSIFGFFAFLQVISLQVRLSKLERQLREHDGSKEFHSTDDFRESLQKRIGEHVTFEFYEDEEATDLYILGKNAGFIQIVDVDEKWVFVHIEKGKKKMDKLIRISSIKGINQLE